MICIENEIVNGFEAAIRGMRNPMNSWDKSDSGFCVDFDCDDSCPAWLDGKCDTATKTAHLTTNLFAAGLSFIIGPNDMKLAKSLVKSGSDHAKFRRMITVYCDILAPLYWWKEFDTYKVGTVANSCSTMHKIADKEFELDDFSHEHLLTEADIPDMKTLTDLKFEELVTTASRLPIGEFFINGGSDIVFTSPIGVLDIVRILLNRCRELYLETKDKRYWWQMIQLLPSSYNQRRTVMVNYEVLANIYHARCSHKLDEWRNFCHWIETLPYADGLIFQREGKTDEDCNTCARINSCEYKPGREELTRYNCPNYSKKESL